MAARPKISASGCDVRQGAMPIHGAGYVGFGRSSPGHEPVALLKSSRDPRSTIPRTTRKIAPSKISAGTSFFQGTSLCLELGASS